MLHSPLRFEPVFRRYLWGGRRLGTVLGKPIGEGNDYAESWEVVDHGRDQSVVASGPHRGLTLHELVASRGEQLLGRHSPQKQFPLLMKFLDSQKDLSLQVHPNDAQASQLVPADLGKTEAWVIVDALPGSIVYAGLKRGFDRAAVEREIHRDTLALCLHQFTPQAGDCLFIPAGTVHALGAGFLVAEIQQASDTTFRLHDWGRVGADGQPRPLHIEQGLAVTDYNAGPVSPCQPQPTSQPHVERLVACDKFILDRWKFSSPQSLDDENRFHIVCVLEGCVRTDGDDALEVHRGETILFPASCQQRLLTPLEPATLLDIYLP